VKAEVRKSTECRHKTTQNFPTENPGNSLGRKSASSFTLTPVLLPVEKKNPPTHSLKIKIKGVLRFEKLVRFWTGIYPD
jgi:hypothetical protein